jgi:fibronectin type 3 domain-containing protein
LSSVRLWISLIALFAAAAFALTGCSGGGAGGKLELVPSATAPAAPSDPDAVGGITKNIISWSAVSGATSYNIYWSASPGVTKATGVRVAGVTSPYTHLGLTTGSTYYYIVTALSSAGESEASREVSAKTVSPSSAPTAVRATPEGGRVTLTWAPVTGATSYNVYFLPNEPKVSPGNGIKLTNVGNPYVHSGLINGTAYYYALTAVVDGIESAPAPVVSAIPSLNPAPAAPFNLKATSSNIDGTERISISWDGPPDATSYNAYYSDFPGVTTKTGTKAAGVISVYRPELPLGDYYVVITAVGRNGESTTSPEMMILTPVFTAELVSGKTIKYVTRVTVDHDTDEIFTFTCRPDGTVTFTSNLPGVPDSGSGTWSVNGEATLTVEIPAAGLELTWEVMSISNNGATVGVYFTKGSEGEVTGNMTIN